MPAKSIMRKRFISFKDKDEVVTRLHLPVAFFMPALIDEP